MSISIDDCKWIMHFRCSFHMAPNHLWFQEFTKLKEDSFLLRYNKFCKITNIEIDKFLLHNGIEKSIFKNVEKISNSILIFLLVQV